MQINELMDLISKLENVYNTDRDFILKYLKSLSNSNIVINESKDGFVKFHSVFIDYEVFNNNLINCINHDDIFDDRAVLSSYDPPNKEYFQLRNIFGYRFNLGDLMLIIRSIISNKEKIQNINQKSIDNLYRFVDCLLHNLAVLSVYFYNDDLDILQNINPENVIESTIKENSDFDIDDELKKLENSGEYIVEYSEEATTTFDERENKKAKDYVNLLRNIGKSILRIKSIMNRNILNIKNFYQKMNVARSIFYKKNIGRIDHLYRNYADEATIEENETKRDPVLVLDSIVPNYMNKIMNGVLTVYNNYNKHIDQLFLSSSLQDMIVKINKYITYPEAKLDYDADVKHINTSLKLDLRYKIATILLEDNEVYGYTVDSIVLNKYPPLNHLIVSLFLKRPHEHVKKQSVSEVFEMADSFKVLNNRFKDFVSNVALSANNRLSSIHMQQDITKVSQGIKSYQNKNFNIMKSHITADGVNNKDAESSDKKDLKQRLNILKNHEHLLQSFIPIFLYIANAGINVYNVAVRVDHTARKAITAMIEVEKEKTDTTTKYKTGVDTDKKKKEKKETAKQKLYKTSKDVALNSRNDSGDKVVYFSGDKKVRKIAKQK